MLTAALSHFTATKPRCATDTFIEELLLEEGILTKGKTWRRGLETNIFEDFTITGEKAPTALRRLNLTSTYTCLA